MEKLRIQAMDSEDLEIISTYLQNGITTISDLKFLPSFKRFIIVFSRFMWEETKGKLSRNKRIRSIVDFSNVVSAQSRYISQNDKDKILEFVGFSKNSKFNKKHGTGILHLLFSGGGMIQLEIELLSCKLTDYGKPWYTGRKPNFQFERE